MAGKTIMPGLVDTHSHMASPAGGDSLGADSARRARARLGQRALHRHPPRAGRRHHHGQRHARLGPPAERADALPEAAPGRHHRRLPHHAARRAHRRRLEDGQRHQLDPRRRGPFPGTRAKSASLVREQFVKAQEYRDQAARRRRRRQQEAGARSGDGGAGRSPRRQAHRALPHPPPRRHRHGAAPGRRSSASSRCCSTSPRAGRSPTRSRRRACRPRSS